MLPASSSPRCSPRRFGQAKVHTLEDKERAESREKQYPSGSFKNSQFSIGLLLLLPVIYYGFH
jgi:hypothetical protein